MTEVIQCHGTISANGTAYLDPIINVYYLSYNGIAPIYAFPQIINANFGVLEQLFMAEIQDNPATTTRNDVNNAMVMLLEKDYPECTFTKTSL